MHFLFLPKTPPIKSGPRVRQSPADQVSGCVFWGRENCRVANLLKSLDESLPNESHPNMFSDHYKDE